MPDPNLKDRVKTGQNQYLKDIREKEIVNLSVFQSAIREMIVCCTKGKSGKSQASLARVIGLSESVLSKIKSDRLYPSPYTFKLSLKLSLFAANDIDRFVELMMLSGHCIDRYVSWSDETEMISYAVSLYENGLSNWEDRIDLIRDEYGLKYML